MSNICYWKIIQNYYDFTRPKSGSFQDMVYKFNKYLKHEDYSFLELLNVDQNQTMRFYMDIDGIPINKYSEKEVCKAIKNLCNNFYTYLMVYTLLDCKKDQFVEKIKITCNNNSNTHPGRGFHIIFPILIGNIKIKDLKNILYFFIVDVFENKDDMYDSDYNFIYKYIDTSIYTTNRLFRSLFSYQPGLINKYKDKYLRDLASYHFPCKIIDNKINALTLTVEEYNDYLIQNPDKNLLSSLEIKINYDDFVKSERNLKSYVNRYFKLVGKIPRSQQPKIIKIKEIEKVENNEIVKPNYKDNEFKILNQQIQQFKYLLLLITTINVLTVLFNLYRDT